MGDLGPELHGAILLDVYLQNPLCSKKHTPDRPELFYLNWLGVHLSQWDLPAASGLTVQANPDWDGHTSQLG